MKAEELMIGDWVHYKMNLGKDGIYEKDIQIQNIYGCRVNCEVRGYEVISGMPMSHLEPIPLTSEILEKNGWMHYPAYREYHNSGAGFRITYYNTKKYPFKAMDGWITLYYVHQLQQVWRLCKKVDLEIKL